MGAAAPIVLTCFDNLECQAIVFYQLIHIVNNVGFRDIIVIEF